MPAAGQQLGAAAGAGHWHTAPWGKHYRQYEVPDSQRPIAPTVAADGPRFNPPMQTQKLRSVKALAAISVAALSTFVSGCAKPGVDIGAKADISMSQPVPVRLDQPIEVHIGGLTIEYEGTMITLPVFNMVEVGSSAEYAYALFGDPDFKSTLSDGSSVWRYAYRPKSQSGGLLGAFGSSNKEEPKPEHVTTLVFIRDNKVSGKWRG
jgi:hypothetical protein